MISYLATATLVTAAAAQPPHAETLPDLLHQYFTSTDVETRRAAVDRIRAAAGNSVEAVAAELPKLRLWDAVPNSSQSVVGRVAPIFIRVTVPPSYDPDGAYPLVLALSDAGASRDTPCAHLRSPEIRSFITAVVDGSSAPTFHGEPESAASPREWLATLKRRYHIDTNRVYLHGCGRSGDAAFLAAVYHADAFAGVLIADGRLDIPYARQLRPILLGNLAQTPLRLEFAEPPLPPNELLSGRPVEVALSNLSTLQCARRLGIPMTGSVVPDGADPASDATSVFASSLTASRTVDHWFRYPLQGRAGFLRATPRPESIWAGDQIDIRNAPETDEDAYIADVLRGKLNHLHGEIRGQTIRITTRGCRSVDILLHGALIDLTAPITVFFNEKRRLSRKVTPTISTLLDAAYEEWEFQRPPWVRLRVREKGRVLPF